MERFEYVNGIGLVVDTSKINSNRLRQLARLGSKYEPYAFRRFDEVKRYSILVAFMLEITQDLIDYAIEIHDRIKMSLQLKGKKAQDEIQKTNGKKLNEKLVQFIKICGALIEAKEAGKDAFTAINARDALYVLDGLLHHETDLMIEEHYTDTAGYQYLFIKKL